MRSRRDGNPARVLILNHNQREHGTYFRAVKVAEELTALGHDVTFVTSGPQYYRGREGRGAGYSYAESPSRSFLHDNDEGWSPFGMLWRCVRYGLRRWDAVFAFSHKPVDQVPARFATMGGRATLVVDWCDLYGGEGVLAMRRRASADRSPLWRTLRRVCDAVEERLERAILRRADVVATIGSFLTERAARVAGRAKVHEMPSGADTRRIRPLDRAACRRKLRLEADAPLLGYIANYHPDEELLLDALERVFRARPDVRLVAVGNGFYGGAEGLERRGLRDRIHHLGRVPFGTLVQVLGAADVLLVPMSDTEFNRSRWPHKIGDYVAAGRAQVACAVGDVPRVFEELGIGVTTAANAEAFARGILKLLGDPGRRTAIEAAARLAAREHFSWAARVAGLRAFVRGRTGLEL